MSYRVRAVKKVLSRPDLFGLVMNSIPCVIFFFIIETTNIKILELRKCIFIGFSGIVEYDRFIVICLRVQFKNHFCHLV